MLGSVDFEGSDLVGKSCLGGLQSSLLGIIDFLVGSFFSVGSAWITFDLNKGYCVLGSVDLEGSNLLGKSCLSSLQSSLLGIINFLVSSLFSVSSAWIALDLNKGDCVLGSVDFESSDLIGKSFLSGLQSSLFGIIDFLVCGLFCVSSAWFSFRCKLNKRFCWCSVIFLSFLFLLAWSIGFSGLLLFFAWLS